MAMSIFLARSKEVTRPPPQLDARELDFVQTSLHITYHDGVGLEGESPKDVVLGSQELLYFVW